MQSRHKYSSFSSSAKAAGGFKQLHNNLCMSFWMATEGIVFLYCSYVCNCAKNPNFANFRFSFRKLQILISFRSISFGFAPFCFANYRKPRWITPSKICIILHILWKPNSLIALLFIQNNCKYTPNSISPSSCPLAMFLDNSLLWNK